MSSFKPPSFQERGALAAEARARALKHLREKQPRDDAVLAERLAAQTVRNEAQTRLSEEKQVARQELKAARQQAKDAVAAQNAAGEPSPPNDAERKAVRDARYRARKQRVAKR